MIFVQPTPGEILKKKVEAIVLNAGFKIKVVERGGRSVHSILQRSDVSPQLSCDWGNKCFICSTKPTGLCREESVGSVGSGWVRLGRSGRSGRACGAGLVVSQQDLFKHFCFFLQYYLYFLFSPLLQDLG